MLQNTAFHNNCIKLQFAKLIYINYLIWASKPWKIGGNYHPYLVIGSPGIERKWAQVHVNTWE